MIIIYAHFFLHSIYVFYILFDFVFFSIFFGIWISCFVSYRIEHTFIMQSDNVMVFIFPLYYYNVYSFVIMLNILNPMHNCGDYVVCRFPLYFLFFWAYVAYIIHVCVTAYLIYIARTRIADLIWSSIPR